MSAGLTDSASDKSATLCLVGAGNMGGAMLSGWLAAGRDPASISVIDPGPPPNMAALIKTHGVSLHTSADAIDPPDLIIVAVKPQIMGVVLPTLKPLVTGDNALLSVAAGTTIEKLAAPFAEIAPRIIRAMPNTPAMVQRGITVCAPNAEVSDEQKEIVTDVLLAIGQVEWVEDESLMDAVTGVSGSGPAYVFYLAEALAQAGEKAGLPPELSKKLARATVSGAGELLHQSDLPASTLRENVTSPNGTTAAALDVLMAKDGLEPVMERAVAAATKRSQELAN